MQVLTILRRYRLAAIPIAVLLVAELILLQKSARTADGAPVYPLDDTYIHLAIAKNLTDHGSWSLTGTGFEGASSAPLWTLLVALTYRLGFSREWMPFALNVFLGCLVIVAIFYAAARRRWPSYLTLAVALAVIGWVPLFATVFTGMEHTLQILVTLLLFVAAGEYLAQNKPPASSRLPWAMIIFAAIAMATRYDNCFLIVAMCTVLAFRGFWKPIAAIGAAAATPVALYAVIATWHGGLWAPSSVLVKGVVDVGHLQGASVLWQKLLMIYPLHPLLIDPSIPAPLLPPGVHLTALLVGAAVLVFVTARARRAARQGERQNDGGYLFAIWAITLWLHLDFATIGHYYRYEAYLMTLGLFSIGAVLAPVLPDRIRDLSLMPRRVAVAVGLVLVLLTVPLSARALRAAVKSPLASKNIHDQQYQMARFVERYYPGQAVALHDIGAVGFFSSAKVVDLVGLASQEVAAEKLKRLYSTKSIQGICDRHGANIAIVYPDVDVFTNYGGLPKTWIPVAVWTIPNNYICGVDSVSLMAINPDEAKSLRSHILEFDSQLPQGVTVQIQKEPSAADSESAAPPSEKVIAR